MAPLEAITQGTGRDASSPIGSGGRAAGAGGIIGGLVTGDLEMAVIIGLLTGIAGLIGNFARNRAEKARDGSFARLGWQIVGLVG